MVGTGSEVLLRNIGTVRSRDHKKMSLRGH